MIRTVGILGGGQLARMIALAGHPLGIRCVVVDPGARPPAAAVARHIRAAYDDPGALAELATGTEVITYEFENVPEAAITALQAEVPGRTQVVVRPGPRALAICQDRIAEKDLLARLGVAVPRYVAIDDEGQLDAAGTQIGFPSVLKTRRLGYDGKGQRVVLRTSDLRDAWNALGRVPCVLEQFVSFDAELALLAVRGVSGEVRAWPLVETFQDGGVLRGAAAPAPRHARLQARAEELAKKLLDELGYVGVLALELFVVGDELLGNEVAPRVHNSGHWTIEGAATSQFENHLRAVLGLPLGDTHAIGPTRLVNLLGTTAPLDELLAVPGAHVHYYDKDPAPGRKLGHVTVLGTFGDEAALDDRAQRVGAVRPERRRRPRGATPGPG